MKDSDIRKMFITWVKSSSWHPCGLHHVLRDCGGEFVEPVESLYQAYVAGIRKGVKMQKDKSKSMSRND